MSVNNTQRGDWADSALNHFAREKPVHCAESIYATILALWEARTELAKLKEKKK